MKLKRLFTAALSAVLALSLCAMPAMAEDGSTTTAGTPKTSTSTIDIGQKGSITIYKRALDGTVSGTAGDGETMTAPGTALKDTGFTLYQVMIQRHCLPTIMDFRQALSQRLPLKAALRTKPRIQKKILKTQYI